MWKNVDGIVVVHAINTLKSNRPSGCTAAKMRHILHRSWNLHDKGSLPRQRRMRSMDVQGCFVALAGARIPNAARRDSAKIIHRIISGSVIRYQCADFDLACNSVAQRRYIISFLYLISKQLYIFVSSQNVLPSSKNMQNINQTADKNRSIFSVLK